MAFTMRRRNKNVAILDADVTGPSIPKSFGITGSLNVTEGNLLVPRESKTGIQIVSTNLVLDDPADPVIWRGPIVAGVIKQFWSETYWNNVDYMFVDMPPGTGDVPLTVFQSLPLNGIIVVTSPQDLVTMIVEKAVRMAQKMNIPVLGLVENMSYMVCPHCNSKISVFGESHIDEIAAAHSLPVLAKMPINPEIAQLVDAGRVEEVATPWLDEAAEACEKA
jgi:Mrp family chromosome partitioning ATPase